MVRRRPVPIDARSDLLATTLHVAAVRLGPRALGVADAAHLAVPLLDLRRPLLPFLLLLRLLCLGMKRKSRGSPG